MARISPVLDRAPFSYVVLLVAGVVAVALACPLMMFVMMHVMMDNQPASRDRDEPVDHDRSR